MHSVRVIVLEGPSQTAVAAQAVLDASLRANQCLWRITRRDGTEHSRFDEVRESYLQRQERVVQSARAAMAAS